MGKSKETFKSVDEKIMLRVHADGSIAEAYFSKDEDLLNCDDFDNLLKQAEVSYGFENARKLCEEKGISRARGEFFPIALADEMEWEPQVDIIIEPLECLLSPRLFSLSDLERIRYISVGEKLAKVKAGDDGAQSRNVFSRLVKDLAKDNNFQETYIGENVKFDARRNVIIAEKEGYVLVENSKRISVIDNIFLQQDIIEGEHEIKTGLTLDGSIFNSQLTVGGNLKVLGKIENCRGKGIIAKGNMELMEAESSSLLCEGDMHFTEKLSKCDVFANGYIAGGEASVISGGHIQAGRYIKAGTIGDDSEDTLAEISIAPFLKGQMIWISQELRKEEWDNASLDDTNPLSGELKDLEMQYLKALPEYISQYREEKRIETTRELIPYTKMRIFHLTREIEHEDEASVFELVESY